ncbi:MAG: hypothetical protein ACTHNI_12860 [Cellulosimicrobium cellulans]
MVRQLYVAGRESRSPAETLRMHPDEIAAEFDRWLDTLRTTAVQPPVATGLADAS